MTTPVFFRRAIHSILTIFFLAGLSVQGADTWTAIGSLATGSEYHTATLLLNGKVLVAGGVNDTYGPLSRTELYDPATGIWTSTGAMSRLHYAHTATLLANGKVLVAGGQPNSNRSSAELYDPNTGTWASTGSMGAGRHLHTATLLTNGKVLVAGGNDGDHLVSSAELYDPATGTWTGTGSMGAARYLHTAILLANGKVLVAGGNDNTSILSSAELYNSAFSITLEAASYGAITGNTSPYSSNTNATLAATPAPGYLFTGWTGDATGTDNPRSVLMDSDKTIGATFSPDTGDPDNDGLSNWQEITQTLSNPTLPDTDGDGAKDGQDAFPLNPAETLDTDSDGTGDNADTDDDGDGLSDADEIALHHTNPKRADSDGDGLSDPAELETHLTNPNVADTDQDGLSDGAEINTHGTLPLNPDTDGDGFLDGYEVLTGKLPLDPLSKPALVAEARTAIEFTFPAALGKTYRIEASLDLATWETVESGIAGTGGQVQRFYSTRGMPKRYFRVEEDAP